MSNCPESLSPLIIPDNASYLPSPATQQFSLYLFIADLIFWGICLCSFVVSKHLLRFPRLIVRSTALVLIFGIATLLVFVLGSFQSSIGFKPFPCWIQLIGDLLVVPLAATVYVARLSHFLFLSRFMHRLVELGGASVLPGSARDDSSRAMSARVESRAAESRDDLVDYSTGFISIVEAWRAGKNMLMFNKDSSMQQMYFFSSFRGSLFIFAILLAPCIAIAIILVVSSPVYRLGCTGCYEATYEIAIIIIEAVVVCGLGSILTFRIRHLNDPWGFITECHFIIFGASLALVGYVLRQFGNFDFNGFSILIVLELAFHFMFFSQTMLQVLFAFADGSFSALILPRRRKSSTMQISLDRVLGDTATAQSFEIFLIDELGLESLLFLREVDAFQTTFSDVAPEFRKVRARKIFNKYMRWGAVNLVNLPSHMIKQVKEALEKDQITADMFVAARGEVAELLARGALVRWASKQKKEATKHGTKPTLLSRLDSRVANVA